MGYTGTPWTALGHVHVTLSSACELCDYTAARVPYWGSQNFCQGPRAPSASYSPAHRAVSSHLTSQGLVYASLPAGTSARDCTPHFTSFPLRVLYTHLALVTQESSRLAFPECLQAFLGMGPSPLPSDLHSYFLLRSVRTPSGS